METYEDDKLTRATPAIIFSAIVALSVLCFFIFTMPKMKDGPAADVGSATLLENTSTGEDEGVPDASNPVGGEDGAPNIRPALTLGTETAPEPLQNLVAQLSTGKVEAFVQGDGAIALSDDEKVFFKHLFGEGGFRVAAEDPITQVGQIGSTHRWAVNLEGGKVIYDTTEKPPRYFHVDLARSGTGGWTMEDVRIPEPLRAQVADIVASSGITLPAIPATSDALVASEDFVRALLTQDYSKARLMTDQEKVTREKIAGLVIVFEEGEYRLQSKNPLMGTATKEDSAWVVVRVESAKSSDKSDFGVELQRGADDAWKVTGVNFSKLLASYAAAAGAGTVEYTPIVKDPQGGESLVLYFEYDEDGLHPRAKRQLAIVAAMLKGDETKTIRITGHADSMGSESYNYQLSSSRAISVQEELTNLGVDRNQILTEGYGELKPLDPNNKADGSDNPDGRSRNRRTEIYLDF